MTPRAVSAHVDVRTGEGTKARQAGPRGPYLQTSATSGNAGRRGHAFPDPQAEPSSMVGRFGDDELCPQPGRVVRREGQRAAVGCHDGVSEGETQSATLRIVCLGAGLERLQETLEVVNRNPVAGVNHGYTYPVWPWANLEGDCRAGRSVLDRIV
jgi:hypothetical protein